MKTLLLLAAQLAATWPAAHWAYLKTCYASDERRELVALAALACFVVAWSRAAVARSPAHADRSLAGPAVGVLVCAVGGLLAPGLPAALLAAVSGTYTASVLCTERRFHVGLFGLALLALPVLPLFETQLGLPLRLISAGGAAGLLRVSGFEVVAVGAALDEAGRIVSVDEPCAGLAMLWTGLLVTFVGANLWRLGNGATIAGAALAVLVLVAANALRTASLFVVETRPLGLPAWMHPAVGLFVELVVLTALLWMLRVRAPDRCDTRLST